MAKPEERKKARQLRREGWGIVEIARELDVDKDTVSRWCRDLELTLAQRNSLIQSDPYWENRQKGADSNKFNSLEKREKQQEQGRQEAQSGNILHLMGCMLYWGEGAKERNQIRFTNTDPNMIILFMRFLREEMGVSNDLISLRIMLHSEDEKEQQRIRKYWLNLLELSENHKASIQVKNGTDSRSTRYEYGICSINVYRTDVVQRIFGAIQEYIGFERREWVEM